MGRASAAEGTSYPNRAVHIHAAAQAEAVRLSDEATSESLLHKVAP